MISRAGPQDVQLLYRFLVDNFYPEHVFPGKTGLNPEKVLHYIAGYLNSGVVFCAYQNGKLVGSISLREMSLWWSDDTYLGDGWFYVMPEARKSKIGLQLMKAAHEYAGSTPVVIGIWNQDDNDRKEKFFKRKGMTKLGAWFMKGSF